MTTSQLQTLIGGAALLLGLHLTAAAVLCFLLGAMLMAALQDEDRS